MLINSMTKIWLLFRCLWCVLRSTDNCILPSSKPRGILDHLQHCGLGAPIWCNINRNQIHDICCRYSNLQHVGYKAARLRSEASCCMMGCMNTAALLDISHTLILGTHDMRFYMTFKPPLQVTVFVWWELIILQWFRHHTGLKYEKNPKWKKLNASFSVLSEI